MQNMVGFVAPEDISGLTFERRQQIYAALVKTGMSAFFSLGNWEQGNCSINKVTNMRDINRFVQCLNDLVKSESVAELKLRGELAIVEIGKKRSEYRIVVHRGRVGFQKGVVQWESELAMVA